MRKMFHVTYEIVTPESAEHGDAAERGFAMPYGWQFELSAMTDADVKACALTLRQAAGMVGYVEDSGRWFSETDGRQDYKKGAETRFDLHPPHNVTGASYARLRRLLKAR